MKTLEYRTDDKSGWGTGPWDDEPDKRQWPDAATGYPCLIVRNRLGALCGYVGVPFGHPMYGVRQGDDIANSLRCHWGITFTGPCNPEETAEHGICHLAEPGEPDNVWWLGFDCAHCEDLVPGMEATLRDLLASHEAYGVYRDFAYVTDNVTALATQLWRAAHGNTLEVVA